MRYHPFCERYLLEIKKATGNVSFQSLTNLVFRFLCRASIPYHFSSFLGNKKGDSLNAYRSYTYSTFLIIY